jgi:5-formyltetrahydrofolate cyclo-ligase
MDKRELRKRVISKLAALSEQERQQEDAAIIRRVLELKEWQEAKNVFCYAPYGWEIDTFPLMKAALAAGKRLAIPLIYAGGKMYAKEVETLNGLQPGLHGIYAPPATNATMDPESIDLVIMPGVAFDINGLLRLGRGGGYYDRYLEHNPALRLALVRDCQLTEGEIIMEKYDLPMDIIVTKDAVYSR